MKKLISGILALLIIFSGTAFAIDLGDIVNGLTSMFAPDSSETYGPKEVVELGDVSIELTNVYTSGSNGMYTPEDGCEYVMIEFSIQNKGDEELTLSTILSFNTWCDGKMCTISLEALATAMFAGRVQLDCVVNSGEHVTGVVGYEVPENWEEIIVEYGEDAMFGEKVRFAVENT